MDLQGFPLAHRDSIAAVVRPAALHAPEGSTKDRRHRRVATRALEGQLIESQIS